MKTTAAVVNFCTAWRSAPAAALTLRGRHSPGQDTPPLYKISLAQWSFNNHFFGRRGAEKYDPLDFAKIARDDFGIDAIEYVTQFYADRGNDPDYINELKKRAEDHGVRSVLIMVDREGNLGDPDDAARKTAVDNHKKWVDAAKTLGCHSVRVNAASQGTFEEQLKLAADGLRKLTEYAAPLDLNVIVENHGGLSSNGAWLVAVMRRVDHPRCGTLPDFGNFRISRNEWYDRYTGVNDLMPYAKGVSAKSYDFDENGNETTIDYARMMKIVVDHNYHGYVGIEYEGSRLSAHDGVCATKALLERLRNELASQHV